MIQPSIISSFQQLEQFCIEQEYKGYDPYDGLNSRLFQSIPFIKNNRLARLAWIQFFKRSPINFRPIVGINKEYNPKALGLFLSGYCRLYEHYKKDTYLEKINFFTKEVLNHISTGYSGACWGYNFDWQAKAFFQPKHTPTVVASSFVAHSLLNAYDITRDEKLLETARSTCDFIMRDLNRTLFENGQFAFSYSPQDKSVVYNATLLGAALLSSVHSYTQEDILSKTAQKTVEYVCSKQKQDGSWVYGNYDFHQWIDNFHTGYNLECLNIYTMYTGDNRFSENIKKGFDYYIQQFFTSQGISKYYNNKTYPIDIHAPAQLVVTLDALGKMQENKQMLDKVISWTIDNMQDEKGYFYYQKKKYFNSRIPYMRWSQAWMFYAYSIYLSNFDTQHELHK